MVTQASKSNPWLAFPRPNPQARLRLFCFPYAGGGASIYRTWPDELPALVETHCVQPPGREMRLREPPFTRIQPLVEAAAQALLPLLDKPFSFFGHSMGAIVVFELARFLRRTHNLIPQHLFISGKTAAQLPSRNSLEYDLPEDEFIEVLTRLNGTPKEALESPELMQLLLPLLRADCEVCDTYEYRDEPPLPCAITAYGGLQDEESPRTEMDAWRAQTEATFVLRMFPGDHFFLQSAQSLVIRTLAQDLREVINTL